MSILDDLQKLSSAEEFFEALGVDYDPAVIRVARLHIMRRMGEYLAERGLDDACEDERLAACRRHLARAYADFAASSPIEQRVFKALKDAAKPAEKARKPFVPMNVLTSERLQPR